MVPSAASRSESFPSLLPILTRRISVAFSMSPPASSRARLQSIIPAPVCWRRAATSLALIWGVVLIARASSGGRRLRQSSNGALSCVLFLGRVLGLGGGLGLGRSLGGGLLLGGRLGGGLGGLGGRSFGGGGLLSRRLGSGRL